MSDSKFGKRIFLDKNTHSLLNSATRNLKDKNCKINDSLLASEIIRSFLIGKNRKLLTLMETKYFDQRKHLQMILSRNKDNDSIALEISKIPRRNKSKHSAKTPHE